MHSGKQLLRWRWPHIGMLVAVCWPGRWPRVGLLDSRVLAS